MREIAPIRRYFDIAQIEMSIAAMVANAIISIKQLPAPDKLWANGAIWNFRDTPEGVMKISFNDKLISLNVLSPIRNCDISGTFAASEDGVRELKAFVEMVIERWTTDVFRKKDVT